MVPSGLLTRRFFRDGLPKGSMPEDLATLAPVHPPASDAPSPAPPVARDTASFLRDRQSQEVARRASPSDLPAESTDAPPVAPAPPAAKPVSKRQETINDYERRLYESNERIAHLEGLVAGREPAKEPPAAPAAKEPAYKRYLAMPDAPKLDDFETLPEHTAAMSAFIAEKMLTERDSAAGQQTEAEALTAAQNERASSFATQIQATHTADPTFWDSVRPEVQAMRPMEALKPGEMAGPQNVIASELLSSPVAPQLMRELSKSGVLERLSAIPEHLKKLPKSELIAQHTRWIVREIGKLEGTHAPDAAVAAPEPKLLTDNAPPAMRLGKQQPVPEDAAAAALKRKDTGSYLETRRQQEAAKRR